jgi:hypothetical protein
MVLNTVTNHFAFSVLTSAAPDHGIHLSFNFEGSTDNFDLITSNNYLSITS